MLSGVTAGPRVGACQRRRSTSSRQGRADRQGHRPGPRPQGHRRTAARRRSTACSRPTTATSRPRTSSTAATSTCTARSRRTTSSPASGPRAPPRSGSSRPTLAEHGWSAGGHTRRRGRHRRHAVPRRLADHGARPASCATCTWSSTRTSTSSATSPARCSRVAPGRRTARSSPTGEAVRESWMHVEIDRIREGDDADAIDRGRSSGCCATSASPSRTGSKMHAQVRGDRRRARAATRRRSTAEEVRQGRELLELAGRRPLHLPRLPRVPARARGRRRAASAPSPAPASASCAPTRTCRRRSAGCPSAVKAKAREKTLLVLAKANSRATVHRPAYLDYVGVKTFDETARSSASAASSACSPARPTPSR